MRMHHRKHISAVLDNWDRQEAQRQAASTRLGVALLLASFLAGMALLALGG